MQDAVAKKVKQLRLDYAEVAGRPFKHFLCPILFRDEDVELCKGHVVGLAFGERGRWTVQRKDVDNFFGSAFEADFADMRFRGRDMEDVVSDAAVLRRFRTVLTADGSAVPHYSSTRSAPSQHTRLHDSRGGATPLVLKLDESGLRPLEHADWEFGVEKDLRLPALVSILKAAHLTLFEMIGYRWALSSGGYLVGKSILGNFYLDNAQRPREEMAARAVGHFGEFAQMVRPVLDAPSDLCGTVNDQQLYVCRAGSVSWGLIVFVKTGDSLHGALMPLLENDRAAFEFAQFLSGRRKKISVQLARYEGDQWRASPHHLTVDWPDAEASARE